MGSLGGEGRGGWWEGGQSRQMSRPGRGGGRQIETGFAASLMATNLPGSPAQPVPPRESAPHPSCSSSTLPGSRSPAPEPAGGAGPPISQRTRHCQSRDCITPEPRGDQVPTVALVTASGGVRAQGDTVFFFGS